uniref:Protein kinase domain-containing protein n=1 Tax=Rhizophagus irregularis (strain DAOM 181602 / DAOM 197198 / MUCL 43194) TaxID=747089 RepID=U9SVK9_RHIID
MIALNYKCEKCIFICNAIHFKQNFISWTSGDKDIDKFIRVTQLSAHSIYEIKDVLEWIPYNRIYNIKYIEKIGLYRANWIDGKIYKWNDYDQNWDRYDQNMIVTIKNLNNSKEITTEFMNEIRKDHEIYGITRDPETKCYMMYKFINWTSGNKDIDKFIQDTQLSVHQYNEISHALEWIPYDRFYDIKYIEKIGVYRANWIDGKIYKWDDECQNWGRLNQDMFVTLESLINPKNVSIEFMNKIKVYHKFYGITQNPETKNYMIVLDNKCEKCNCICNSIYFQQNFDNWTSGNKDIDKFIQDTQLSAHTDHGSSDALEWIPYDRCYNIEFIAEDRFGKIYKANWIDGFILKWNDYNQNWDRYNQNIVVTIKNLNISKEITTEFMNVIRKDHKIHGITQDLETQSYMVVLSSYCRKWYNICNATFFQQNFINWTSGNNEIDGLIQDTQLSVHKDNEISHALEWIPYSRFYNIKYIEKIGVYRANWIDGYIHKWDDKYQNWGRLNQDMLVTLENLINPKNVSIEFIMNKIKVNHKFYGVTQNPETKNYMMVLNNSGNKDIDKFIQDTQLSAHTDHGSSDILEWIPYNRFHNVEFIAEDRFGKIYKTNANWIDGFILKWNHYNQNWDRFNQNMVVTMKNLNNSKEITTDFMNEKRSQNLWNNSGSKNAELYGCIR